MTHQFRLFSQQGTSSPLPSIISHVCLSAPFPAQKVFPQNSMSDRDEKVAQLVEMTGCALDTAVDVLNACGWSLENAVEFLIPGAAPPPAPKIPKISPPPSKQKQSPPSPPKETNVIGGTCEKFQEQRAAAQAKERWLLVHLTEKPERRSILADPSLRDFFALRFVGLSLNREEPDGWWFYNTYQISVVPCFAGIDPETGECMRKFGGDMYPKVLYTWMYQFLIDFPQKGLPIELEQVGGLSSSSESSEEEDSAVEDEGNPVTLLVQLPDGKRSKIEVGDESCVKVLYSKVAALMGRKPDSFKLSVLFAKLTDMDQKISEAGCLKALIRVVDG